MSYEFQSIAYGTRKQLCTAIAEAWIIGDDSNIVEARASLARDKATADSLTRECIVGWELEEPVRDWLRPAAHELSFMDSNEITQDDIRAGFERFLTWLANVPVDSNGYAAQ